MSKQAWQELLTWATASGTSINTSAAETIIYPNITIPANYLADGRTVRLTLYGSHSTLGSGTVTTAFFLRWGGVSGTVICKSGTITQVVSLTTCLWRMQIDITVRSNGATGTVMGNGFVQMFGGTAPTIGSATGAPAIAPMTNGGQTIPAVATLDLTADTQLAVSAQMGASSASNIILGLQYTLESLN
jgi:hypothetical protein